MKTLALVVPTLDRPDELRRMLESLRLQTVRPSQVVVVDAGSNSVETVVAAFPELNPVHLRHWPPSAAAQRNAGLMACDPDATLIGFVDDDMVFEPDAFERMMEFWESTTPDVLGAAFAMRHFPENPTEPPRSRSLACWLGLYPSRPGAVAPSGWHSAHGTMRSTQFVQWLPAGAVVWRSHVLSAHQFDEFFHGYSYLEDLDFSFGVGRKAKLAVVADACCSHFPSPKGRISTREFGRIEVRNRLHLVRKHGLSLPLCYCALGIRIAMTVMSAVVHADASLFRRAAGNLETLLVPGSWRRSTCANEPR